MRVLAAARRFRIWTLVLGLITLWTIWHLWPVTRNSGSDFDSVLQPIADCFVLTQIVLIFLER